MTVAFIPASDLKRQYSVIGHFYSLNVAGVESLKCRSVLEIMATAAQSKPTANAVFVMMNPGSSRPVAETNHVVDSGQISQMTAQLVPTVPDTTQYQVMRVMHYLHWQHVRVINLSDLRDPQSGSFVERYAQLEKQSSTKVHSVFAPERSVELKRHLSRQPNAPIVCAWGVSHDLDSLIARALDALPSESELKGLVKPAQPGKYFHPLPALQPQKEQWVNQILDQLNA